MTIKARQLILGHERSTGVTHAMHVGGYAETHTKKFASTHSISNQSVGTSGCPSDLNWLGGDKEKKRLDAESL